MEVWLHQIADQMPYVAVLGTLVLSGFGLPLPEDVPLILAGYLCAFGYADPYIMFPACFIAILGADAMVFYLGRKYGHHVPKLPLLRRYLTEPRLAKTEEKLHAHGGKFIFVARFLPGLRTAAYFTAGSFKLPYWTFLLYDGLAALVSVPLILGLSYAFAEHIEEVRRWVWEGQAAAIGLLTLVIAVVVVVKLLIKRRFEPTVERSPESLP